MGRCRVEMSHLHPEMSHLQPTMGHLRPGIGGIGRGFATLFAEKFHFSVELTNILQRLCRREVGGSGSQWRGEGDAFRRNNEDTPEAIREAKPPRRGGKRGVSKKQSFSANRGA
jgi:hypothetical protein